MKIKAHMSLCRPERDKTINESTKLGFGCLFIERYETSEHASKWSYNFNGMTFYKTFVKVEDSFSDQRL